jgi:colanic acid/amylovoran biosynthesis protein
MTSKVLLIGDLGWRQLYHLGDEAMSEAAIETLNALGIADITLVAGVPDAAKSRYGLDAVSRPGFRKLMSSSEKEERLHKITSALNGRGRFPKSAREVFESVAKSDAIVVGGGGNLNSHGAHHIYDRVALARFAQHLGKPLFISSQTIGPILADHERQLVTEIADTSVCFGVREEASADLMRALASNSRIVPTMDDAILLSPAAPDRVQDHLTEELPKHYIIGSFTHHTGTTGLSRSDYAELLVRILDALAIEFDVDVLLVPHLGSFIEPYRDDQLLNNELHRRSITKRIRTMPMLDARDVLTLTAGAEFTVSTRYHPVVFGPALGVPSFGLVISYYSSIRMRGALRNVGLADMALPFEYWSTGGLMDAIRGVMSNRTSFDEHVTRIRNVRRREQLSWWKSIVRTIEGNAWHHPGTRLNVQEWNIPGVSGLDFERITRVSDRAEFWNQLYREKDKELRLSNQRVEKLEEMLREKSQKPASKRKWGWFRK